MARGRKFGGRKRKGVKKNGALAIAKKALRRTALNRPEMKAVTLALVDTDVSTALVFQRLCVVTQGIDADERIGHEIRVRGLQWKGTWISTAADGFSTIVRMIIIQDKQQISDGIPAAADVLNAATDVNSLLAFNATSKGKRFRVLYDRNMIVTQGQITADIVVKGFRKLNSRVMFNGPASTDIQRNGIYVGFMANEAPASTDITMSIFFRLFYTDS